MVRSDSEEMSAMPGLAMLSSAKGMSLSTTTARFIGTFRGALVPLLTTLRVSAYAGAGAKVARGMALRDSPTRTAFRNLSIFM